MRKKLLLSRSGFEKPESREEAIMQNILGASNVLEPSESNIEEILKSILYNTPYTKEAEFEIEKILLAIKNNGTYDGECESRDLKILFAILNDLDYTEEAESRIEELFIEWLNQRAKVKVLEGVPPLTFVAKGEPLINYEISGNTIQNGTPTPDSPIIPQGVCERTGNLWNENYTDISVYTIYYLPLYVGLQAVTMSTTTPLTSKGFANLFLISGQASSGATTADHGVYSGRSLTVMPVNGYVTIAYRIYENVNPQNYDTMLNEGNIALPYEPYGYKIPILSANTTTNIYLGEVETTRNIKKLVLTGNETLTIPNTDKYRVPIGINLKPHGVENNLTAVGCTHFIVDESDEQTITSENDFTTRLAWNGATEWFFIPKSFFSGEISVSNCRSQFAELLATQYAAGTPVTVWYVLATEETGIVNEPLMKIGDYADTLSMEQAGVEIPTVNGSNTLDVDTTVKPSNIYIEYKLRAVI